jgi:hypothetical protein
MTTDYSRTTASPVFLSPRFGRGSVGFRSGMIADHFACRINAFSLIPRPDVVCPFACPLGIGYLLFTTCTLPVQFHGVNLYTACTIGVYALKRIFPLFSKDTCFAFSLDYLVFPRTLCGCMMAGAGVWSISPRLSHPAPVCPSRNVIQPPRKPLPENATALRMRKPCMAKRHEDGRGSGL